jgi:hypothetical protein
MRSLASLKIEGKALLCQLLPAREASIVIGSGYAF